MVVSGMLDRSKFTETYQAKARANLAEAAACLHHQLPRATISRSYYALYQAANAWLSKTDGATAFDAERPNRSHEEIEGRWRQVLGDIQRRAGIQPDFDGDKIYTALKSMRVRVDYKSRLDPTMDDAADAVAQATRAVGWLLSALKKVG